MRRIIIFLYLLSFLIIPNCLFSQSTESSSEKVDLINELSIEEIQNIIFYFNQLGGFSLSITEKEKAIFLLESVLQSKILSQSQGYIKDQASHEMKEEIDIYRIYEIANILEKFFERDIFLNSEGDFTLSNKTPIIKKDDGEFSLRSYQEPLISIVKLKEGSALEVFLESIKYPNYTLLYWNDDRKEYGVFLDEYDELVYLEDIDNLDRNKLIILFGKLFPVSLEKPAWAWRLFGMNSIKKESKNLIYQENQAKLTFNS